MKRASAPANKFFPISRCFCRSISLLLFFFFLSCRSAPTLKAIKVAPSTVESTVSTISSGTVHAEQQAVLSFGSVGRVGKILAKAGDKVTQGQVLAELENSELQIIFSDSQKEFERAKKLFQESLVSRVALDEAKKALEVARAHLDKSVIKAPFDGVITELNLELGELAQTATQATKPPIRIVDLKPRVVKGDIDEIDLSKVKTGNPARVRIPAVRNEVFAAEVTRVIAFVDTTKEQDRTSQIELKLMGETSPLPVGASAEIEIVTEKKENALAIPTRVVLGRGDSRYVYRFESGKIYKTDIRIGTGNYLRSEVVSGLKIGDTVVFPSDDVDLKDQLSVKVETLPWP